MIVHNKVVVRFRDGRLLKGFASDFFPTKDLFHLSLLDSPPGTKPVRVQLAELKAIFFVRDLASKARPRRDARELGPSLPGAGRRIRVVFADGEILVGTTQGYQPGRVGFFVVPADRESNNERCFVIASAAQQVSFL
jgi:hypothetical protein